MQVYIVALEEQNRILKDRIEAVEVRRDANSRASRKSSAKFRKGRVYRSDDVAAEADEEEVPNVEKLAKQLSEERSNLENAHKLIERYSDRCKQYEKQLSEGLRKIGFLEKLVIEKDNS